MAQNILKSFLNVKVGGKIMEVFLNVQKGSFGPKLEPYLGEFRAIFHRPKIDQKLPLGRFYIFQNRQPLLKVA
jgi:hypothetical protein